MRGTKSNGSACQLKGCRGKSTQLQDLVAKNGLGSRVDLNGAFCSGNCVKEGVCVTVDGELFSVKPEETKDFFEREILGRI